VAVREVLHELELLLALPPMGFVGLMEDLLHSLRQMQAVASIITLAQEG